MLACFGHEITEQTQHALITCTARRSQPPAPIPIVGCSVCGNWLRHSAGIVSKNNGNSSCSIPSASGASLIKPSRVSRVFPCVLKAPKLRYGLGGETIAHDQCRSLRCVLQVMATFTPPIQLHCLGTTLLLRSEPHFQWFARCLSGRSYERQSQR